MVDVLGLLFIITGGGGGVACRALCSVCRTKSDSRRISANNEAASHRGEIDGAGIEVNADFRWRAVSESTSSESDADVSAFSDRFSG